MSDTPEVDAFLRAENCSRDNPIAFDWLVGLARSLERRNAENDGLRCENEGLRKALNRIAMDPLASQSAKGVAAVALSSTFERKNLEPLCWKCGYGLFSANHKDECE